MLVPAALLFGVFGWVVRGGLSGVGPGAAAVYVCSAQSTGRLPGRRPRSRCFRYHRQVARQAGACCEAVAVEVQVRQGVRRVRESRRRYPSSRCRTARSSRCSPGRPACPVSSPLNWFLCSLRRTRLSKPLMSGIVPLSMLSFRFRLVTLVGMPATGITPDSPVARSSTGSSGSSCRSGQGHSRQYRSGQ